MSKLLEYFKGDELAASVWQSKYARENEKTPFDMHKRMSKEFFRIESKYIEEEKSFKDKFKLSTYGKNRKDLTEEDIFNFFDHFKFILPQGSIMSTLGTDIIASLSNCWVIESPYDSYAAINKTDGDLIFYYTRRGGCGVDISRLRPKDTITHNTAKLSTGAISFMPRFSNTTREVAMNGRRGALLISIDVRHPDIMDFIKVKQDRTSVTGANISIQFSDDFMQAVKNNEDYYLTFPVGKHNFNVHINDEYDKLYSTKTIKGENIYYKKVRAKEIWNEFVKSARDNAEPGIMYMDNVYNYDPSAVYKQYRPITSNPCGEQFLSANDSCRLIASNLFNFIENPFTNKSFLNEDLLYEISYESIRIGDALVDLEVEYINKIISKIESDPEPLYIKQRELDLWKISKEQCLNGRRIGLGITALGDMLAAMNIRYGSEESFDFIDKVMAIKFEAELDATIDLAILRNPFIGWNKELEYPSENYGNNWYKFVQDSFPKQAEKMKLYGRRNISTSTVAPTGTVSILANNCTSGCEPIFMPYYIRRKKVNPGDKNVRVDFIDEVGDSWQEYAIIHNYFKQWILINTPIDNPEELTKDDLQSYFEKSPWFNSTSTDVDWKARVKIQSILQKYTTNAISSTINLPETITYEDVSNIYMEGWTMGLKGQTVYVEGSRSGILVNKTEEPKITERPDKIPCKVIRFKNEKKNWIAFVGTINNHPYEIFTGVSDVDEFPIPTYIEDGFIIKIKSEDRSRYDFQYIDNYGYTNTLGGLNRIFNKEYWNYARFVSALLREDTPIINIIKIIEKLEFSNRTLNSWQSGIIRALKSFIEDGTVSEGEKCPDCGAETIVYEGGCKICKTCGSSACG